MRRLSMSSKCSILLIFRPVLRANGPSGENEMHKASHLLNKYLVCYFNGRQNLWLELILLAL